MNNDTCWVQLGLKNGDEALNIKVWSSLHIYNGFFVKRIFLDEIAWREQHPTTPLLNHHCSTIISHPGITNIIIYA